MNNVRKTLKELKADRIRQVHHLAAVQAELDATDARIGHLEQCLPELQEMADKIKATGGDA